MAPRRGIMYVFACVGMTPHLASPLSGERDFPIPCRPNRSASSLQHTQSDYISLALGERKGIGTDFVMDVIDFVLF